MAVFGGYETVGQALSRVGLTAVWRAAKAGSGGAATFAVKAVEPAADEVAGPEEARRRTRALLASTKVQAGVAASGGRHWAPVHEQGETPGGAFYVTDYYSQTVAGLIRGRVKLSGKSLLSLVRDILEGLRELDSASSRPHGNLKPSNILIREAKEPGSGNVFLADPLSDSELDKTAARAADLAAIGNMIFRLVCRRNFNPVGDWPVGDNPDWSALGKAAPAWRELCSVLLSPSLASQGIGLDDVARRLGDIGKAEATTRKPMIAAIGVAVLVVVIAVVVLLKLRGRTSVDYRFDSKQYQVPFKDYRSWLSDLAEGEIDKEISVALWNKDDNLKGILEILRTSQADIRGLNRHYSGDKGLGADFRYISEEDGTPADERVFGDKIKNPEISAGIAAVKKCSDEIRRRYALWDPEKAIQDNRDAYKSRSAAWKPYADYLSGVTKPPFGGDPIKQIHELAKLTDSLATIANCWREIENAKPKMAETGDVILGQFPAFVDKTINTADPKPDLVVLADKLGKMAELAKEIAKRIETDWATTDKEAFKESEPYRRFQEPNKNADEVIFELWSSELASGEYTRSDKLNPYLNPELGKRIESIGKLVDAGAELAQFLPEKAKALDNYKRRLDKLAEEIDEFSKKPVSPKSKGAVTDAKKADEQALDALEKEIAAWKKPLETRLAGVDPRTEFQRDTAKLRADIAGVSDQEKKTFESRLDAIEMKGDRKKLLNLEWISAYEKEITAAFRRANDELAALRADVPKTATVTPAGPDPGDELERIRVDVADSVKKVREAGATALANRFDEEIKSVPSPDPGVDWLTASETVRSEIKDACKKGVATLEPIGSRAMKAVEDLRLRLPDENVMAGGSPSIEAFWKSKRQEVLASLTDTQNGLGVIADWQKRLVALDGEIQREAGPISADSYLVSAADVFSKKREATLKEELPAPEAASLEGLDSVAARVKGTLATVDEQIRGLDAGSQMVKSLIYNAAPVESIADAYDGLKQDDPVFGDFQNDLSDLTERVNRIKSIAKEDERNRDGLLGYAMGADAASAFTAWRQLESFAEWPKDMADMKVAIDIAENLIGFVARAGPDTMWLRDKDEREKRQAEIVDGCRDYLARSLGIVASAASERADWIGLLNKRFVNPPKDSGLAGILSQDAASRQNLDRAGYDVGLYEFAGRVRGLKEATPAPDDDEIKKSIDEFISAVPASVLDDPYVDTLRKALNKVIDPEATVTGKATTWPAPANWVRKSGPDASSVTYSSHDGVHTLTFKRVNADGGNVYICTTEMSVGVFVDVLSDVVNWYADFGTKGPLSGKWANLEKQTWISPRAWSPKKKGESANLKLNEGWVPEVSNAVAEEWRKAAAKNDTPTLEHPMQYISPEAAVYVAGKIGFRLPTVAEWKEAWIVAGKPVTGNLRGKTWKDILTEVDGINDKAGSTYFNSPRQGVFLPHKWPSNDKYFEGQDHNDGHAWFDEVGSSDSEFHNLVGNVAEFVYADDNHQKFQVVGGSALSQPDLWDGMGKPFWTPYDYAGKESSDVGFRLAFDAPLSISDNLLEAMDKNVKYLGPSAN